MKKDINFEDALSQLEEIVRKIESGAVSLDESLSLFESGVSLIKLCNEKLESAEQKVKLLTETADGGVGCSDFSGNET